MLPRRIGSRTPLPLVHLNQPRRFRGDLVHAVYVLFCSERRGQFRHCNLYIPSLVLGATVGRTGKGWRPRWILCGVMLGSADIVALTFLYPVFFVKGVLWWHRTYSVVHMLCEAAVFAGCGAIAGVFLHLKGKFREGDRVGVSENYWWARGVIGTVAPPPNVVSAISSAWRDNLTRVTMTKLGAKTAYWVWFDEPQRDADGDGPYKGAEIGEA